MSGELTVERGINGGAININVQEQDWQAITLRSSIPKHLEWVLDAYPEDRELGAAEIIHRVFGVANAIFFYGGMIGTNGEPVIINTEGNGLPIASMILDPKSEPIKRFTALELADFGINLLETRWVRRGSWWGEQRVEEVERSVPLNKVVYVLDRGLFPHVKPLRKLCDDSDAPAHSGFILETEIGPPIDLAPMVGIFARMFDKAHRDNHISPSIKIPGSRDSNWALARLTLQQMIPYEEAPR